MKNTKIKKGEMSFSATSNAVSPKISLFYKLSMVKALVCFFAMSAILISPLTAHAGFFSFMSDFFTQNAQANELPLSDDVVHNSQTVPLLEPSLTTDLKNVDTSATVTIVGDEALESKNGPMGTEADFDNGSYISDSKFGIHVVQKGETLDSIAKKEKVSKYAIIYANSDIKRADLIKVGTVLTIMPLNGIAYSVKKGETAESVATKYGTTVRDIVEYNLLEKASEVNGGDTIFLVGVSANEIKNADTKEKSALAKAKADKAKKTTAVVETPIVVKAPAIVPAITPIQKITDPETNIPQPSGQIAHGYIWPFPQGVGSISQLLHGSNGIDFRGPIGTPIFAVADGTILIADSQGYNGGYGLYVVENFDNGTQGMYAHMSKVAAVAGTHVKQGQIIGYVGSTGKSTGPHLHFEVRGDKNPFAGLKKSSTSDDFHD